MKRTIFIYSLLNFFTTLFAQEVLFEQDITLSSLFTDKRESLPIVNADNNEFVLFLLDNKSVNGLLFNEAFELENSYSTSRPETRFNTLLGHSTNSEGYHLFFTTNKKNQFCIKTVNPADNTSENHLLPLKLKKEKVLESISYKNKFYLITILKMSSIMKIYEFTGNTLSRSEKFDFSAYKFSDTGYGTLYSVFAEMGGSALQTMLKVHKIDNSNPNPLDLTTKENKIYYYNDKIYFTIDNNIGFTKLISIDLVDYSSTIKYYGQVNMEDCGDAYYVKSNSYLYGDKLFQIKGCIGELCWQIKDLQKDSLLKEFRVKSTDEITVSNTPFIQEGGTVLFIQGAERELERTKQVLRKISKSDIGVTVYPAQENFELTIGGFKEVQRTSGAGMYMGAPGTGFTTSYAPLMTAPAYHYNPTYYGYNTYTNTRSVYFKSLIDGARLNHVPGDVSDNAFDRIKTYEDEHDDGMASETIFKMDNFYVFGYYKKWDKKYHLVKFME